MTRSRNAEYPQLTRYQLQLMPTLKPSRQGKARSYGLSIRVATCAALRRHQWAASDS
jgi:hypothetical protein